MLARFTLLSIIALVAVGGCSSSGASTQSSGAFDPLPPAPTNVAQYVPTSIQNANQSGSRTVDVTSGFPAGYGQVQILFPPMTTSVQSWPVPLTVAVYAPSQGSGLDYVPSLPAVSFYIEMESGEDLNFSKLPGLTISMQQPPQFKRWLYYDGVAWQTVENGSVQGNTETFAPAGTSSSFVLGQWYVFAVE